MAEIKIKKARNTRPRKNAEAPATIKSHNKGKVSKPKAVKAKNTPSNYGVK
jgi:hypothetical protein